MRMKSKFDFNNETDKAFVLRLFKEYPTSFGKVYSDTKNIELDDPDVLDIAFNNKMDHYRIWRYVSRVHWGFLKLDGNKNLQEKLFRFIFRDRYSTFNYLSRWESDNITLQTFEMVKMSDKEDIMKKYLKKFYAGDFAILGAIDSNATLYGVNLHDISSKVISEFSVKEMKRFIKRVDDIISSINIPNEYHICRKFLAPSKQAYFYGRNSEIDYFYKIFNEYCRLFSFESIMVQARSIRSDIINKLEAEYSLSGDDWNNFKLKFLIEE